MNFSHRTTAFALSHRFWIVVSSFLFVSRNFLISFLISFFTHSLFNSMLFNLHVFYCFGFFSLRFVSSFSPLWSEKMLDMISIFLNLLRLVLCPIMWSIFEKKFHVHLKRMCILLLWDEKLYIYQLSPFHLGHCSMPHILVDILFGRSVHFWQWGVKIPYYNCVAVNIFLEVLQDFLYVFECSYAECIYIYYAFVFLVDSSLSIMKWPFGSLFMALLLKSILSDMSIATPAFYSCPFAWNIVSSPSLSVCLCPFFWGGSPVGSIRVGHDFLSIPLFCVFWLDHLIHLHLRLLLIGTYSFPFFHSCVPLSLTVFFLFLKQTL